MKRILRWDVPVDDSWHAFDLAGPIVHVGARKRGVVEFWTLHNDEDVKARRALRVYGTGQELPARHAEHHGAVYDPGSTMAVWPPVAPLVWHLVESCPAMAQGRPEGCRDVQNCAWCSRTGFAP